MTTIATWRSEGKRVSLFLDDGFDTDDNYEETKNLACDINQDLLPSGFIPNVDKCIPKPIQEME
ncbi:hypothetical protein DPMN_142801 [Dreissena polymorpha]|uniref:Uncharacterized protein n=1 Tax=Dreissena polymorpha TaxID=45954 RepID=A0A9D4GG04_DREPO|nr:hypothetical protein DPMN_142801 [Dreissena polymorpha]